jgi:parallel beta-helix repeat protein
MRAGAAILLLVAAGCAPSLCRGVSGPCQEIVAGTPEAQIQSQLVRVAAGTTLMFDSATYRFSNGLSLATPRVTIAGQGMDKTIFDFAGQVAGSQGIYASQDGFVLRDLTVRDSAGDGVKVENAKGVTMERVHVEWTDANPAKHGAYALYPVSSSDVLIDSCVVEGASDSGIYVGQSQYIRVHANNAHNNVAGIEIENSHYADVWGNSAQSNSAGILVFALPNLQVLDTHDVRIYDNTVSSNNTTNFAAHGDIVSIVPAGSGLIVMASDRVELFGNTVSGNETFNAAVVSYLVTQMAWDTTTAYYPYPTRVWIHDNTFSGGGDHPDTMTELGLVIGGSPFPNHVVSSVLYDGIVDSARPAGANPGNPMDICLSGNGTATFANVKADMMSPGSLVFDMLSTDAAPFTCQLTALSPVTFM